MTLAIPHKPQPIRHAQRSRAGKAVAHWGINEVQAIMQAARSQARKGLGERDALFVATLFDPALRVSEALGLRPIDVVRTSGGFRLTVDGKTGPREAAASPSLIAQLQSYAYECQLDRQARFFPFNRFRAWQIVSRAEVAAGLIKPAGVGSVHILRHSGAIERMLLADNPKHIQDQLGHMSFSTTARYLQTLIIEESLQAQERIDFGWR